MTKFIVKNNVTDTAIVYTDINKARCAVSYLSWSGKILWYMEIKAD